MASGQLRQDAGAMLMDRPRRSHSGIQFDLAESALVAGDILLQQSQQGLGLLRAEVDALKIADFNLAFALLLQRAENHEEVPDIHPHLDTIGVGLSVVGGIHQLDIGLWRKGHRKKV